MYQCLDEVNKTLVSIVTQPISEAATEKKEKLSNETEHFANGEKMN